jgi:hypothetical protein
VETSANEPITKAEFIARADAICERTNAESIAAAEQLKGRPVQEILARALAIQGKAIQQLRALERPRGDEKQIRAVLVHLDRLQKISRMLDTEGEEILAVVAGIAVETDAVARAAHRYGLFRSCGAYQESPEIQRILRGEDPVPQLVRGPDGKIAKTLAPARIRPAAPPAGETMRRLAARLVPPGAEILRRQECADPGGIPTCVTMSLEPGDDPAAARRAALLRRARELGWRVVPTNDGRAEGVALLRRGDYEAVIWVVAAGCKEGLGDGPNPKPTHRCVDTIMVQDLF